MANGERTREIDPQGEVNDIVSSAQDLLGYVKSLETRNRELEQQIDDYRRVCMERASAIDKLSGDRAMLGKRVAALEAQNAAWVERNETQTTLINALRGTLNTRAEALANDVAYQRAVEDVTAVMRRAFFP